VLTETAPLTDQAAMASVMAMVEGGHLRIDWIAETKMRLRSVRPPLAIGCSQWGSGRVSARLSEERRAG
jgi:hypothetical protein